ncbi:class I SAM-dependent methyltransferase [Deefgea tanakiae]|uniref:Class I SAM-dependent methyltransferase n=1 Tax=Deefgea tanakiae TaxID=2865840 RepID=A0ABX8ZE71_9NEIS|nr:class I SAM-dependent methyltransferase [Deefgea tanakiae]QZA79159.1 class I SAM-dependent methyltransferase [Deefgea tanakiae]
MMSSINVFPQWLVFALICAFSFFLVIGVGSLFSSLIAIALASSISFLLAKSLHDGFWWKWIHLFFLPLIFLCLQLNIAPHWYLLALVLSWFVFGKVMVSRVPLYLSNQSALSELESCIPLGGHFLDVGAGTGKVLQHLSASRADLSLCGVEQAKAPWLWGKFRLPSSVRWINADYQGLDFADYDCIYAFLSPAVMADLWSQARSQMKPGSLFISNSFEIPGVDPDQVIELNDWKNGKLLLWRM